METFKLTILGRGSAMPTPTANQSAQILEAHEKLLLIDCGEGTQISIRKQQTHLSRLNHIFISHVHGDHCFGLIGLLSTLSMMGRRCALNIYCHPELQTFMQTQINFFGGDMGYPIIFNTFSPFQSSVIYEDRTLRVTTFPLKHTIPSSGFLIEEKPSLAHLNKQKADFYRVPLSKYMEIKNGADFITENGFVIPNAQLTIAAAPPKRYAYCSDTAYNEKVIPYIQGVDCLYHEATFLNNAADRAKITQHSTAAQAAEIAKKAEVKKLIIGHFSARYADYQPLLLEAKSIFANTLLAEEFKTYPF